MDGKPFGRESLLDHCREAGKVTDLPAWRKEVYGFIEHFLDPSREPILQKTSGTTGDPREYPLHRERMIRSAQNTLEYFRLQPGNSVLLCLPIRYIAGKMMVVRALVGGLNLVLTEPSSRPLQHIRATLTLGAMVPLQVHESLHSGDNLGVLQHLIIGGGELHTSLRNALIRRTAPAVYESFGMTETYTHFAMKRINGAEPDKYFRLLKGVSIRQDHRDCLVVDVEGITHGEIITGDLVEMSAGGKGFMWLGRYDHVINSGGIKIIPELLEEKIREWLGLPCLLLPEKDARLGERLVLLVEYGKQDPPLEAWSQTLRERLGSFEVPKRVVVVKRLPRNEAYKPDRIAARELI